MADWMCNIARELTASHIMTDHLLQHHPHLTPFSPPPFPATTALSQLYHIPGTRLKQAGVTQGGSGEKGGAGGVYYFNATPVG